MSQSMQNDLLTKICETLAHTLQIPADSVTAVSSMATLEPWDSLQHINVIVDLEERFQVSFSSEEVTQLNSVQAIVDCLLTKLSH